MLFNITSRSFVTHLVWLDLITFCELLLANLFNFNTYGFVIEWLPIKITIPKSKLVIKPTVSCLSRWFQHHSRRGWLELYCFSWLQLNVLYYFLTVLNSFKINNVFHYVFVYWVEINIRTNLKFIYH